VFIADNQATWDRWLLKLKAIFTQVVSTVKSGLDFVKSLLEAAVWVWENFGDNIWNIVRARFEFILSTIKNVLNFIQGVFKTFSGLLAGDWAKMWDGIKQVFSAAWDQLKALFQLGWTLFVEVAKIGGKLLGMAWDAIWDGIKALFRNAWDGIKWLFTDGVTKLWNWLKSDGLSLAVRAFKFLWDNVYSKVPGWLKVIFDTVKSLLGRIWDWMRGGGKDLAIAAMKKLWDGVKAALLGLGELTLNIAVKLLESGSSLAWKIIKSGGSVAFGAKQLVGAIGGNANGGTAREGQPGFVGERGPELFVPGQTGSIISNERLHGMLSGMSGGSSRGGTTVIQVTLDGRIITESVYSGLLEKRRRTGALGLA
jgi:phage-related protein